jgi:hypothetical protein
MIRKRVEGKKLELRGGVVDHDEPKGSQSNGHYVAIRAKQGRWAPSNG